jgi:hypothetical protein
MNEQMNMEHWWNDTDREEKGNLSQCCRSHVDSLVNKHGLSRDRLATNCLSHDIACDGYCLGFMKWL